MGVGLTTTKFKLVILCVHPCLYVYWGYMHFHGFVFHLLGTCMT